MKYLMGVDNGGTFSKAALFDENGEQVAKTSVPTVTLTPKPGYTERDMDELWCVNAEAIRRTVESSGVNPSDIAGISFSGHGKGLYLADREGNGVGNGIPSTDARAWEYILKWKQDGTSQKVYEKTFQEILVMQPVALLAWIRDHQPDILDKADYIFSVNDYIRFKLTGEAFAEYTIFSGGNLVNLTTRQYDQELLDLFGLGMCMEKLPPLRYSGDICGHITKEAALLTGLPEGIPVAAGMFDVDACGLASGLTGPAEMCMIAGTWSINEFISEQPITNGTVALNSMYCMKDYFLVEESSPTSAGNMEWFIQNLLSYEKKDLESEGKSVYDLTNEWVESIEPQDCNVIFLPFLNGSNEHPLAKSSFVGLTAFHNKKHMLRAVYEGIVFSHLTHVKKLLANREKPSSIRLSGGAANSAVWVQMFADALQIPIDTIGDKELGAQGAAMAAGVASGVYKSYEDAVAKTVHITGTVNPRPEYQSVYEKKYDTYRKVNECLNAAWDRFEN
ncbi:MAG: carbohydrate kinase [Lachnospiraceae bacterium]|nr:carbohydrate kinase [Lachnospiraceae bacterium]